MAISSQAHAESALEVKAVAPDGSPAHGIAVRATNTATDQTLSGTTDSQGRLRFGALGSGGTWRIETDATSQFRAFTSDLVSLRSEFQSNVTLRLEPVDAGSIVVTGLRTVSALNTSNAEVSATLTADEIRRIPVEARSLERLLFRLPGVTQSTGFFAEAPAVAINGANALYTNYTIDGLDNNENFLGGQRFPVPVGAIQDVTVLSGSYSVEYGRTANGVVNVTTPSGGNTFSGEAFFVTRPGGFTASRPDGTQNSLFGAPVSDNFQRYQGGVSLSGPIVKDRTFFFLNAEYVRDVTDNVLSAPALGVNERLTGRNEQILITGRLDHNWSDRLRTTLRFNHGRVQLERQGGGLDGGVTFPSAGSVQDRYSTNIALINTYAGDGFDYTGAFQYGGFDWNFGRPLRGAGPQATVYAGSDLSSPIAVIGSPGYIFDETERTFQTQQKLTFDFGRHRLKIGGDLIIADFSLQGGGNIDGNYAVSLSPAQLAALQGVGSGFSISDLPADVTLLNANFEVQPRAFGVPQRIYSAYIEDQFQATDDLSLTLGLRYDYDSLTAIGGKGDTNNFAPRFSFNYTPSETVAIRGGIGLYTEKIPYSVISDAIQQGSVSAGFRGQLQTLIDQGILPAGTDIGRITSGDGNASVDLTALCTAAFQCPDPTQFGPLADTLTYGERRIFNPSGLDNPQTLQLSLGVEWQAAPGWLVGVDAQYARGRHLLRLVDLDAPAPFTFNQAAYDALGPDGVAALSPEERAALGLIRPAGAADATRPALNPDGSVPEGGARSIIVTDSGGRSRYAALIFKLQKAKGTDPYDFSLFYTLSTLRNDTDDINFRANDANNFRADYGPSLNDRTHVISALVNLYPTERLTVSLAGLIQSGQPVNYVPDAAIFGTTDLNGDGLSFSDQYTGNPDRAPGLTRNSGRLPWAATFDLGLGYRFDGFGPGGLDLRADVFNLFDANNKSGFPVNFTSSNQIQVQGRPFVQNSASQPRSLQLTARYRF
ncbi:TonB-dependent receptor domain-containing protein [Novosphingobium beihaiensis]|uniref:TonB-dependent receptor n=1 Tax=Novosphingobium beihaiensis TaxID=2930389 RepID=A0ABT0BL84_9SPHN|nr:TonB-dependent receptor [Novosphingobium beihaiensis]MCJ2185802.1 TonB-dependent receptor [Novosphingobium beihaiensis]